MATQIPVGGSGTSKFFGVYKTRVPGNVYAASISDKEKGHTVHFGTFEDEEEAARAHDIGTFLFSGSKAKFNYPMRDYEEILELMKNMTKQQVMTIVKRCSSRFVMTSESHYYGVSRILRTGKWMAYKGEGDARLFAGIFGTKEEAAIAYDLETIKVDGWSAVTNFDIKMYNVEAILDESTPPNFMTDKPKLCKEELLKAPKNCTTKGKAELFLERLGKELRGEMTETV